jgi:protein-L-isoaspartate(D-aspartate) O-methyltransferase
MKRIFFGLVLLTMGVFLIMGEARSENAKFSRARNLMVTQQIITRGITDAKVLHAMGNVGRHQFVPRGLQDHAYADQPLPIGEGQTISQPYIVALMTASLQLTGNERILEIGTGSGYQAAILAEIVKEVYTIEIKETLFQKATHVLQTLKYTNVSTRHGDGYFGWKEAAPFDGIMITAAVDHIPAPLLKQLKNGGRLILPLGNPFSYQNLVLVTKKDEDYTVKQITGVLFVPLTGYALRSSRSSGER